MSNILEKHPIPWSVSNRGQMTYITDANDKGIILLDCRRLIHYDKDIRKSGPEQMKIDVDICNFIVNQINRPSNAGPA